MSFIFTVLKPRAKNLCLPVATHLIKDIRIITWGYDSSVVNAFAGSSQASVFGHAETLLTDIASPRMRSSAARVSHVPQSASQCTKR